MIYFSNFFSSLFIFSLNIIIEKKESLFDHKYLIKIFTVHLTPIIRPVSNFSTTLLYNILDNEKSLIEHYFLYFFFQN